MPAAQVVAATTVMQNLLLRCKWWMQALQALLALNTYGWPG